MFAAGIGRPCARAATTQANSPSVRWSKTGGTSAKKTRAWPPGVSESAVGDVKLLRLVEELLVLGRALERSRRGLAALHRLRHRVEIAGADLALVLDRREPLIDCSELGLLQL